MICSYSLEERCYDHIQRVLRLSATPPGLVLRIFESHAHATSHAYSADQGKASQSMDLDQCSEMIGEPLGFGLMAHVLGWRILS